MLNFCMVHKHRDYVPLDRHHILPKSEGGATVPGNLIWLCVNGHREVHEYLRLLHLYVGSVPWLKRRKYGKKVRNVAEEGYKRILGAN